jgi:hypothetical protein
MGKTLSFAEWREQADMPTTDPLGQWYDAENGLYFNRKCRPALAMQLRQFWGKKVTLKEITAGMILVQIRNSRESLIAERTVVRAALDRMPEGNDERVEWACGLVGIGLKD